MYDLLFALVAAGGFAAALEYEAEQRRINKLLAKIGRAYGMDRLSVYARFSNGETWYRKEATA